MFFYGCLLTVFIGGLYLIAKRSSKGKFVFSRVTVLFLIVYLIWRAIFTLPTYDEISFIFGLILYSAEVIGLFVYIFFILLFSNKITKDEQIVLSLDQPFEPHVAIFVCTYNEDLKLVIATALAARALKYPNKEIYICDDGHRNELEELANRFNLNYLSRKGNEHAKAGNINHALANTESDLVMILDADFIVKKNIIFAAVDYFRDEEVALVQYPQAFYNKDPFQLLRGSLYNEQELFMRFLEPALSRENALIHVGTNAIIRRSAIEKIGGIPTNSITEDMATGMLLQNAGFRTLFINKAYALGITPYTAKELSSQRKRWAQGTIQIFKNYKPRKLSGLSKMQKLCYYNAYLYWFTSFQKLIYLLAPTLFMVFTIFVVKSESSQLFLFFLPPLVMVTLAFRLFVPKIRTLTTSHIYDCFVAPIHASALIKEFFKTQRKFTVTKKNIVKGFVFDWYTVFPHIILASWIVFACILALYKIVIGTTYFYGYLITLLWSFYNLYGLFFAIAVGKNREVESDSEALSITVNKQFILSGNVYEVYQMSYNGFRIRKHTSLIDSFTQGTRYLFNDKDTGLEINSVCIKQTQQFSIFSFDHLTIEAAEELASFYSDQLHAAKKSDFDVE
ncbi:glycosyltransferase [Listeria rocourtiae]|uniref:glycosyltransferase n=1 Tax=Listeria rocourtiae TaxID=647910 RepID=UPI00162A9646|nr:glycosyltransferase [Listeria rocourtiae]MBC1605431.1 glycosyltransferase [Listeria rocourtiae]